jgi:hypothetical protein
MRSSEVAPLDCPLQSGDLRRPMDRTVASSHQHYTPPRVGPRSNKNADEDGKGNEAMISGRRSQMVKATKRRVNLGRRSRVMN